MMDDETLQINEQVRIPLDELSFRYSRSSGPGGQHAQKSSTRVELLFDVANSPSLTDAQRARVLKRLGSLVDSAGVVHLTSQSQRSQLRNREEVTARFEALMRKALKPRKRRKPTEPTAASREKRLRKKKQRSQVKEGRGKIQGFE
ncbi:MAG TPA: alternative ribosome rescue aminoacyl-tRNA hydrolase ArfB [Anaerolineae bacterium]|nr:alternative ribosome rescue aminoacyl-tRNA hydrolase ArfB [Anaerolineae bacterium]